MLFWPACPSLAYTFIPVFYVYFPPGEKLIMLFPLYGPCLAIILWSPNWFCVWNALLSNSWFVWYGLSPTKASWSALYSLYFSFLVVWFYEDTILLETEPLSGLDSRDWSWSNDMFLVRFSPLLRLYDCICFWTWLSILPITLNTIGVSLSAGAHP